ncbi:hypothetical protein BB560_005123 [Smittium megazygosporum]|uniref:Uncharacterized protein n=1 Tax=Smittium megazygosporum TaxID=133381 RepID=A0A2T9Z7C4_9FUNG|nr:hypothetical protein BB560_005123 [Smittium megazygosporum]
MSSQNQNQNQKKIQLKSQLKISHEGSLPNTAKYSEFWMYKYDESLHYQSSPITVLFCKGYHD